MILVKDWLSLYIEAILFIFGSIFGSFVLCACSRYCNNEDWVSSRSKCDFCGHVLNWYDLIPVLSYIFCNGRCRYCKEKISILCPLYEIYFGIGFVVIYLITGQLSFELLFLLSIFVICNAVSLIDIKIQEIPDALCFCIFGLSVFKILKDGNFNGLLTGIISMIVIGLFFIIMSVIMDKVMGKESFGGGDIKLLMAFCINFSLLECLLMIIVSCLLGLLISVMARKKAIPFGPAICFSCFLFIVYGKDIIASYIGLFM